MVKRLKHLCRGNCWLNVLCIRAFGCPLLSIELDRPSCLIMSKSMGVMSSVITKYTHVMKRLGSKFDSWRQPEGSEAESS